MLIQKLNHCRMNGQNLPWIKNYLTNRKLYIEYDGNNNNRNNHKNNSNYTNNKVNKINNF